jgi:hypothetical protein
MSTRTCPQQATITARTAPRCGAHFYPELCHSCSGFVFCARVVSRRFVGRSALLLVSDVFDRTPRRALSAWGEITLHERCVASVDAPPVLTKFERDSNRCESLRRFRLIRLVVCRVRRPGEPGIIGELSPSVTVLWRMQSRHDWSVGA